MADIFDIEAARRAGYAPDEILAHIVSRRAIAGTPAPATLDLVHGSAGQDSNLQDLSLTPAQNGFVQTAKAAYKKLNPDFGPVTGTPVASPADLFQLPQSKTEAALLAAGALIPPAKALSGAKGLVRAGTTLLEGAAPEIQALTTEVPEAAAATSRVVNALGNTVRGMMVGKKYTPLQGDVETVATRLNPEDPAKAMRDATGTLVWQNWDRPATIAAYGKLRPSNARDTILRRLQNVPDVVSQRAADAADFLARPTEPWQPVDYGIFDRGLIKDAMGGFPGVEQTSFPRRVAPRADMSYVDEIYADPRNRALIKQQIERGLPLGGSTFYPSLYPVKAAAIEAGIPATRFDDWINSVAPGSARNSIFNERAVGNFLRNMHARGIPLTKENVTAEMAKFEEQFGGGLPLMDVHRAGAAKVLEGGVDPLQVLQGDLTNSYKIPTYSVNQRGNFAHSWTGDTHEAAGETLGSRYHPYFAEQGGFGTNEYGPAEAQMRDIAREMSLPTGTAQAGRWFGGGELTGLVSPRGDSLDLLEKQAAYTMHRLGLPTDPQSVRRYILNLIDQGGTMLPWYSKGPMPDYRMKAAGSQSRR